MVLLFAGSYYFINKIIKGNETSQELNKFNNLAAELTSSLITYSEVEHQPEFFETGEDKYSKKIFSLLSELNQKNKYLSFLKDNSDEEIAVLFIQADQQIAFYQKIFTVLNANVVKVGNSNYGYFADVKFSGQSAHDKANEYGNNTVEMMFETISLHEAKFYTDFSKQSQEEFSRHCENLINYIRFLSGADKYELYGHRQIADATAKYMRDFESLTRVLLKNGLRKKNGTFGQLTKAGRELTSTLSAISKQVDILMVKQNTKNKNYLIAFSISAIILIFCYQVFITRNISSRLLLLKQNSKSLSLGKLDDTKLVRGNDEISEISVDFEVIKKSIITQKDFVHTLATSDYTKDVDASFPKGEMGEELLKLRTSLQEKELQREKNEVAKLQKDWHVNGLAEFGDILREHAGNADKLTYTIISQLTGFLGASIGGFYVSENTGKSTILKLRAAYAYDKKKIIDNEIEAGEGLIGTCAVEQTTFYFDKIPDNYVKIHSGFGSSNPESLLIVPITNSGITYGIIELASLGYFTKESIYFTEMLCEDIASTLSYMMSNISNERQLDEMAKEIESLKTRLEDKKEEIS